jgi:hypothetical protein
MAGHAIGMDDSGYGDGVMEFGDEIGRELFTSFFIVL